MSHSIDVKFDHPVNAGILRYLLGRGASEKFERSASPDSIPQPYYSLGTHLEFVERLWDKLGGQLPEDCRWALIGPAAYDDTREVNW